MMINLLVTDFCNMECEYCYEDNDTEMKTQFARNLIPVLISFIDKYSPQNKSLWINFHGGEPLLHFQVIQEIVRKVKQVRTCRFSITTNASLLNQEMMDFFDDNKFFLSISMDGPEDVYMRHRKFRDNKVGFADIVYNISGFNSLKNIRYRVTVTPATVKKLYESIRYLISLHANCIVVVPDYCKSNWIAADIRCFKLEMDKINTYIGQNSLAVSVSHPFINHVYGICTGGENEITINTRGEIFPCMFVCNRKEFVIGNIGNGIDGNKLRSIKNNLKNGNKKCPNCNFVDTCINKRCIYLNYAYPANKLCEFTKTFLKCNFEV